jgi:hypothetical protein
MPYEDTTTIENAEQVAAGRIPMHSHNITSETACSELKTVGCPY